MKIDGNQGYQEKLGGRQVRTCKRNKGVRI